jgi:hypothetical protein
MNTIQEDAQAWVAIIDALRAYASTTQQRRQWGILIASTEYEYGRHEYARAVADDVAHTLEGIIDDITEEVSA